jgi:hypothetical protein
MYDSSLVDKSRLSEVDSDWDFRRSAASSVRSRLEIFSVSLFKTSSESSGSWEEEWGFEEEEEEEGGRVEEEEEGSIDDLTSVRSDCI